MRLERDVVEAALRALHDDAAPAQGDLVAALTRATDSTRHLFGADGAGVMLLDDQQALAYVQTEDEDSRLLEAAQRDLGQGPCVDCLVLDHVTRTSDLQTDERWPEVAAALRGSDVHAVLGVPIRVSGGAVGSLNVLRHGVGAWDPSEIAAIGAYASVVEDLIASALLARSQEQLVQQLRTALEHRVVIDRAVGFLMAARGVDAVLAFDELRRRARARRRRVADLAAELLESGALPSDDASPHPDRPGDANT